MTDYTTKLAAFKAGEHLKHVDNGCECLARNADECGCLGATWTTARERQLAAANTVLLAAVEELRNILTNSMPLVSLKTVQVTGPDMEKQLDYQIYNLLAATADLQAVLGM